MLGGGTAERKAKKKKEKEEKKEKETAEKAERKESKAREKQEKKLSVGSTGDKDKYPPKERPTVMAGLARVTADLTAPGSPQSANAAAQSAYKTLFGGKTSIDARNRAFVLPYDSPDAALADMLAGSPKQTPTTSATAAPTTTAADESLFCYYRM